MASANDPQTCPICCEPIPAQPSVSVPCKSNHMFHQECLQSWLLTGSSTCPCDRQTLDPTFLQGMRARSHRSSSAAHTDQEPNDDRASTRLEEYPDFLISGNMEAVSKSAQHHITALRGAKKALHARSHTLAEALRMSVAGSCFFPAAARHENVGEEYETLKRILADILRICISFLNHPYFRSCPSELNRFDLMMTILKRRNVLLDKRRLAIIAVDSLNQADFFASLSAQQRASLHGANDGRIWYLLKLVVGDGLAPGSSELEGAVQRASVAVLDEMCSV
jgi:hypothetical protein